MPNLFLLPFSISVTFHDEKDDSTKTVQVPIGQSLLEAAHANDVDLEGEAKSRSQKPWRRASMHGLNSCYGMTS